MAYIGNTPAENYASFLTQTFSVTATASYTLDHAVSNENDIRLVINNVVQQPGSGKAYTASGTTLTLSEATQVGDVMYCVYLGRALQTVNPPNNSVGASQLNYPLTTFSSTGIDDNASANALTIDSSSNLQFNSGYGSVATAYGVRAWVQYNDASAIVGSGNVSSITDNGTGDNTINFATNMPDANYCVVTATYEANSNTNIMVAGINSTSVSNTRILTNSNASPGAYNVTNHVAIIR